MPTFQKGTSGNPSGKVRGTRNRTTLLCEKLLADDAADVVRAVIAAARDGDVMACKLRIDRIVPLRRARVGFAMPRIEVAGDVVPAIASITEQVAAGVLSPDEGTMICDMIEVHRKAIETMELEAGSRGWRHGKMRDWHAEYCGGSR